MPYDVEVLWEVDDRDSVWSDNMRIPKPPFPERLHTPQNLFGSTRPGVNDQFDLNPGVNGFFNFNDFNADYWFVTGVPVPGP